SYDVTNWLTISTKSSLEIVNKRFPPSYPWYRNYFPEDGLFYNELVVNRMPYKFPVGNWSHRGTVVNPAQLLSEGGYRNRSVKESWLTGAIELRPIKNVTINVDYTSNIDN